MPSGKRVGNASKRPVVGKDASGRLVRVGDTVRHTKNRSLAGGVVTDQIMTFRGEPAVLVRYPMGNHLNRLSQMTVMSTNKTVDQAAAALKLVELVRARQSRAKAKQKLREFLKICPRDRAQPCSTKKVWKVGPEVPGGLPSLGKKQ